VDEIEEEDRGEVDVGEDAGITETLDNEGEGREGDVGGAKDGDGGLLVEV